MSKFFRSADSSGSDIDSSDSGTDSTADVSTRDGVLQGALPSGSHAVGPHIIANGKDWLLHSLLEERCLNQVRAEQHYAAHSERELREEASRRYRSLVTRLAPLDLISAGLEDDRHVAMRQNVRDILDSLGTDSQALQAASKDASPDVAPPFPLRRMLTEGNTPATLSSPISTKLFDTLEIVGQPTRKTRYFRDFDELGPLGRGGYGEVFHVRNRLDQREYAVKKIPIRPSIVSKIITEGESAMDEVLLEIRTLSELYHANIVRYFSSWIEMSSSNSTFLTHSALGHSNERSEDAVDGADSSPSFSHSLHRVRTGSDGLSDDIFESRPQHEVSKSISTGKFGVEEWSSRFGTGAELERYSGPTLTLHMQMDVYPMTLADFITPKATSSGILPLSHCFHLDTSVRILLAILDGVQYLHSKNMVHRDLKPANIFLRHEDDPSATPHVDLSLCSRCSQEKRRQPAKLSVHIGDFGLVTKLAEPPNAGSFTSPAGTELYRPKSMNVGSQLDLHATGVMACELLCRFDTQMERKTTLNALREGHIPNHFTTCTGMQSRQIKSCIEAMLARGDGVVSIDEVKHRLTLLIAPQVFRPLSASDEVTRRSST